MHTPGGSGKPVLISIPRDSYLPIPGHGKNKVNAAFAIGGPKLLAQTLEQATGLPIDGYVEIGFGGFAGVVDSLGGVDVCVKRDIKDAKAHIDLKKGCQTLDGKNALGYVRARYSDPKGDLGRAERQRQFLGAIMKKAATPATVLIPWRWWGFTHTAASSVIVGEDTSLRRHLPGALDDAQGVVRRGAQPRRAAVDDQRDDPRRQLGAVGRRARRGPVHDAARGRRRSSRRRPAPTASRAADDAAAGILRWTSHPAAAVRLPAAAAPAAAARLPPGGRDDHDDRRRVRERLRRPAHPCCATPATRPSRARPAATCTAGRAAPGAPGPSSPS